MVFETEKAREQVRRILEYVACPGVAFVLDADGSVLALAGEPSSTDLAAVGALEAPSEHPWILPTRTDVVPSGDASGRRAAWVRALPGSRRLVAILPSNMLAAAAIRVERAAVLLTHMTTARARNAIGC